MTFLLGMAGALLCIALVGVGFFLGWKTYPRFHRSVAPGLSQEAMQKLKDQQEAFRMLMNYSVEDAYGMNTSPEDDRT